MKRSLPNAPLFLFLGLLILLGPPAAAQDPAVVYLDPAELTLSPGDTAGLSIQIEGAAGLYGLEIHLAYDPAVVQLLDADPARPGVQLIPGDFLDPEEGFLVANTADNTLGQLDYALTLLAPAEAVSGTGLILAFELRAIAGGTSPLELTAILASADGASLPVTVEGSRVTVTAAPTGGGASPTPALASTAPQSTPLSPTATAVAEEGGAGGGTTRTVATREAATSAASTEVAATQVAAVQTPFSPAEATAAAGAAPTESPSTGTGPASETVAGAGEATAIIPADQPGLLDPPDGPGDVAAIGDQAAAGRPETDSQAGSTSTPPVGWFILGSFLLFAAILFFGRRLLRRQP